MNNNKLILSLQLLFHLSSVLSTLLFLLVFIAPSSAASDGTLVCPAGHESSFQRVTMNLMNDKEDDTNLNEVLATLYAVSDDAIYTLQSGRANSGYALAVVRRLRSGNRVMTQSAIVLSPNPILVHSFKVDEADRFMVIAGKFIGSLSTGVGTTYTSTKYAGFVIEVKCRTGDREWLDAFSNTYSDEVGVAVAFESTNLYIAAGNSDTTNSFEISKVNPDDGMTPLLWKKAASQVNYGHVFVTDLVFTSPTTIGALGVYVNNSITFAAGSVLPAVPAGGARGFLAEYSISTGAFVRVRSMPQNSTSFRSLMALSTSETNVAFITMDSPPRLVKYNMLTSTVVYQRVLGMNISGADTQLFTSTSSQSTEFVYISGRCTEQTFVDFPHLKCPSSTNFLLKIQSENGKAVWVQITNRMAPAIPVPGQKDTFYQASMVQPPWKEYWNITSVCNACGAGSFSPEGTYYCSKCPDGHSSLVNSTECFSCAAGYYSLSGDARCTKCPNGTVSSGTSARCTACPLGSIPDSLQSSCVACPAGYYSNTTLSTRCTACPAGYYSDQMSNSTRCIACLRGTYSDVVAAHNQTFCKACKGGSFSASDASTFCMNCTAGSYSELPEASLRCIKCSAGSYSAVVAATSIATCALCPAGTYSLLGGSTTCTNCSTGTYSSTIGAASSDTCIRCSEGHYAAAPGNPDVSYCLKCPAGYHQPSQGQSSCSKCSVGSFAPVNGSASCTSCSKGYYMNETGSTACYACPSGTYNPTTAATSESSCVACKPGTYGTVTPQTDEIDCFDCPAGTYQPVRGAYLDASCISCPAGTFSNVRQAVSSTTCQACPTGTVSSSGSTVCYASCEYGYIASGSVCIPLICYGKGVNDSTICGGPNGVCTATDTCNCKAGYKASLECADCEAGSYATSTMTNCTLCPVGSYSSQEAADSEAMCLKCPAGTYGVVAGAKSLEAGCYPCPIGTFNNFRGANDSSRCLPCPKGTFNDKTGQRVCLLCGVGNFNDKVNQSQCSPCHDKEFCPPGSIQPSSDDFKTSQTKTTDPHFKENRDSLNSENSSQSAEETRVYLIGKIASAGATLTLLALILVLSLITFGCFSAKQRCGWCVAKLTPLDLYTLKHFVRMGESPVNRATFFGAVSSILFLVSALGLACFLMFDILDSNVTEQTGIIPLLSLPEDVRKMEIKGPIRLQLLLHNFLQGACDPEQLSIIGLSPSYSVDTSITHHVNGTCDMVIYCQDCTFSGISQSVNLKWDISQSMPFAMASSIEYYFSIPHFVKNQQYHVHQIIVPSKPGHIFRGAEPTIISMSLVRSFYIKKTTYYFFHDLFGKETIEERTRSGYTVNIFSPVEGALSNASSGSQTGDANGFGVSFEFQVDPNVFRIMEEPKNRVLDFVSKVLALISALNGVIAMILANAEKVTDKIATAVKKGKAAAKSPTMEKQPLEDSEMKESTFSKTELLQKLQELEKSLQELKQKIK